MKTPKFNKQQFLQKYIDHKLNSIRVYLDDLSDYLTNYTHDEHTVYPETLSEWGVDPDIFIKAFNPTQPQITEAIKKSPLLDVLVERYKQAVIKGIPKDIINNILEQEKDMIYEQLEEQKELNAFETTKNKLKSLNLTAEEKKALKQVVNYF